MVASVSPSPAQNTSAPFLVGTPMTLDDLEDVARRGRAVILDEGARAAMQRSREAVEAIARGGDEAPAVYGVNTGFGFLAETRISAQDVRALQRNLVRSHACGVGPRLSDEEVRGMILLRAQVIALGCSGVRVEVAELLLALLNHRVHPIIPSQGSVGASGDLAPLAHLALVLIGEGEAMLNGVAKPGGDALREVGLVPVVLEAKEGLGLINGTQYMASVGGLAVQRARRLATMADIAGAMSLEANMGSKRPFDARIMAIRPHPGQAACAENLRALLVDSELMESHRDCKKVQDAYSFRCMPQVHGASRDALQFAADVLTREINSVTDNPLVFTDGGAPEIISGGNFHGQPLAFALDLAAMATAELANISERRVEQLVNPALSSGLTPFLARASGLHSGFMIAQVTSASLVSENKVLCHPASVDSIPSSAGKEDHVSMGSVSAKKLKQVVENVAACLAIELIVGAAGVDQRAPLKPARGVIAAHQTLREHVLPLEDDRPLYLDIEAARRLIDDGSILAAAVHGVGTLH
jgi:histidine ammonia-lyase